MGTKRDKDRLRVRLTAGQAKAVIDALRKADAGDSFDEIAKRLDPQGARRIDVRLTTTQARRLTDALYLADSSPQLSAALDRIRSAPTDATSRRRSKPQDRQGVLANAAASRRGQQRARHVTGDEPPRK